MHQTGLFSSGSVVPQSKFTGELWSLATVVPQSKSTELWRSASVVPQSKSTALCSSAAVIPQSKSTEMWSPEAAVIPQSKSTEIWSSTAPFHHNVWYSRHRGKRTFYLVGRYKSRDHQSGSDQLESTRIGEKIKIKWNWTRITKRWTRIIKRKIKSVGVTYLSPAILFFSHELVVA